MLLLWNVDGGGVHLAGYPFGVNWITDPVVAADLETAIGPMKPVRLHTIKELRKLLVPKS